MYLATVCLGNIAAFVSFWIIFAANFGIIGFLLLVLTIFLADMTTDLIWYSTGRSLRDTRFGGWLETHIPGHAKAEAMLQRKGKQWIFISKFMIGFAPAAAFSIGWSGMEFKKFYKNSVLSILLWLPILTGLSYGIVSASAAIAIADFKKIEWIIMGGLFFFIVLNYAIASGAKELANRYWDADSQSGDNLTSREDGLYYKE
jgi:membrane protein DedA with SNARE-associated domain